GYTLEALVTLQQTAKEQDLVDGGDGRIVYRFTIQDALESDIDWGKSGDKPDRNVRRLFNPIEPQI
ncbi:MAG: hypothetical protein COU25_02825, partial [Candidatus Levybacteria bacterium CG10_big_fil_rev_8_21_14_0_10_35_13]